jgi:hypothetical protein
VSRAATHVAALGLRETRAACGAKLVGNAATIAAISSMPRSASASAPA